jgi:hypothetical protein
MHPAVDIVVGVLAIIDTLVQWGFGWRYLLSASFRRKERARWSSKSALTRIGEGIFIAVCFLIVNGLLAAVLWRFFVGPIKPIHEWRT